MNKKWIASIVIIFAAVIISALYFYLTNKELNHEPEATANIIHDEPPAIEKIKKNKRITQKNIVSSTVLEKKKHTGFPTPAYIPADEESEYYQEIFYENVLESLPVTMLQIEKPGILMFRTGLTNLNRENITPSDIKNFSVDDMAKKICDAYREHTGYGKDVSMSFWISGRPAKAFFFAAEEE